MKFKKILVYNIDRSKNLDPQSWKKIETLGNKIVFVAKDDPKLRKELADTDCMGYYCNPCSHQKRKRLILKIDFYSYF